MLRDSGIAELQENETNVPVDSDFSGKNEKKMDFCVQYHDFEMLEINAIKTLKTLFWS